MARRSSNTNEYTYNWNADTYGDSNLPTLKITKSSFGSFQWCPKKYEFSYIDRKPQDTSEAMYKGTIIHNAREAFFDDFDIKKAEELSKEELVNYCYSLHPIDDYTDMYETMAIFEANRFIQAKKENALGEFLPVGNEILLNAKFTIHKNDVAKFPLKRDYTIHLQGIVDRLFIENNGYIPMELKTGLWKDYKKTMMRKEMAFYKLLYDNAETESLKEFGLDNNNPMSHWAWYYPASNYMYVEAVKKSSTTAVISGIAELIKAYENGIFPTKYFARTCASCSYFGICEGADAASWL